MPVGGEDEDEDFGVVNLVDEAVFFGDGARPLSRAVAGKLVGMAGAGGGMLAQLFHQFLQFLIGFGFRPVKACGIVKRLLGVFYLVHSTRFIKASKDSPGNISYTLPSFAC